MTTRARALLVPLVRTAAVSATSWALLLAAVPEAGAQVHVGPQLTLASEGKLGLGARLVFPPRLGFLGMDAVVDAQYFPSPGGDFRRRSEVNANLRFPIPVSEEFAARIGAGANATFGSLDAAGGATDTDVAFGLNLLAAAELSRARFMTGRVIPFAELRLVVGGESQVAATVGVTFGSPRD